MNQPRCVLLAALALAALLVGSATAAQTDLSLNLRYDDPNDMTAGGTWTLVAKTDDANGVSAVSAYMGGLSGLGSSIAFTSGLNQIDMSGTPQGSAVMEFTSGNVNAVYGQDMTLPVVGGVGTATSPAGLLATDPLKNTAWNNSTAIMTGTFGGTRPTFVTEGANETDSNVFDSLTAPSAVDADTTVTVRGDSVATDGLARGDANRSFNVDGNDLSLLLASFNQAGGWGNGDFNSSGTVDGNDLSLLLANFNTTQTPPSVGVAGIPEPASFALLGLASLFVIAISRKRQR